MAIAFQRLRRYRRPHSLRSRRRRSAAGLAFGVALVVGLVVFYAVVLGPGLAANQQLLSGFEQRSYRPGQVAALQIEGGGATRVTAQFFLAGGASVPGAAAHGWDKVTFGKPMSAPVQLRRPATGPWVAHLRLGSTWPSGDYVARLTWVVGQTDYAPFILRPSRLGTAPVLVVEPTNTWHAYDDLDGDSWYLTSKVHTIDLTHPFTGTDIRGAQVPTGLPEQFWKLDLGFLRWYWPSGYRADFFSDDDLEQIRSAAQLRCYSLIVFAGHEEYVTSHVYDLISSYRNAGGNLAFLSANNFFYKVDVSGNTMTGRTRWRDLGRPEAALIGAQYVGWDEGKFANNPYRVVDTAAAPWLFAGTHLRDGSRFGDYGIEIDEPNGSSPRGTHVLAVIPHEFGPGKPAKMTIYRVGRATVFDAGVFNFGASAHWGTVAPLMNNLWSHLSGEVANP